MNLKNNILLAFVFVLSVNGSVYSEEEESDTPYTDMMLKCIFDIKLDIERKYNKMWIRPSKKIYFRTCYLVQSLQRHEWLIRDDFCDQGYRTFYLQEFEYLGSPDALPLEGEGVKIRTNEGEVLAEKSNELFTKIDERMKCKTRKNGCLKCLLVVPTKEFEEKFKEFVKEKEKAQSATASQNDEK